MSGGYEVARAIDTGEDDGKDDVWRTENIAIKLGRYLESART
jgi:hypothetical protein